MEALVNIVGEVCIDLVVSHSRELANPFCSNIYANCVWVVLCKVVVCGWGWVVVRGRGERVSQGRVRYYDSTKLF